MPWLNYHHLFYFWTVAREGALVRGAEKLHLSPSTVSTQIHRLEDAFEAKLFDRVGRTTEAFPDLFRNPVTTPLDCFLREKTNTDDPWQPLRENHKTVERFVSACHERLDGRRILQYLKAEYRQAPSNDGATLREWLSRYGSALPGTEAEATRWRSVLEERAPAELSTRELDAIRRMLFRMEDGYRKKDDLRV